MRNNPEGMGVDVWASTPEKGPLVLNMARVRDLRGVLAGIMCVVAMGGSAIAQDQAEHLAARDRVAQWSNRVWTSAHEATKGKDSALNLLTKIPEGLDDATLDGLVASIDRYEQHIDQREKDRAARIEELNTKLDESLGKKDTLEALTSALELQMISLDEHAVFQEQKIQDLIKTASDEAAADEEAGKWLDSYALYSRLHLLTEDEPSISFKKDEARLRDRIEMLRLYVPKRLHDMQDARRQAMGDDALPAYNGLGDDWHDRLKGIEPLMVKQALGFARDRHVDHRDAAAMMNDGIERVRTLVTTHDLAEAFPTLGDQSKVDAFLGELDKISKKVDERGPNMGRYDIWTTIDDVLSANKRTVALAQPAVLHEFGTGATTALDQFTSFYWPDDLESFNRTASGNFTGVGIQITLNDDMELEVVTPVYGTPAFKAGIKAKDLIRTVDGHSTTGMGTFQAVQEIVGPAGTTVTLGIERKGVEGLMNFTIKRAIIPLYSVKGWKRNGPKEDDWDWMIDPTNGIGYVRLTQFIKGSGDDLRRAVSQMMQEGANGIILDLRFNGGGLLDEAVDIANIFLDGGTIVTQEDGEGHVRGREEARAGRALAPDIPLVVLVNESSASASEIVSGALQDHDRAVIVGKRSFGKGSVQNVFELAGGRAAFKLTTQYYKLPSGRLIHRRENSKTWGVQPDVDVDVLPQQTSDALDLRLDADVVDYDDQGHLLADAKHADPQEILDKGVDPQLETAVLLLDTRVVGQDLAKRASLN